MSFHQIAIFTLLVALFSLSIVGCKSDDKSTNPTNTAPIVPSNPTPANNATGVATSLTLSWNCNDSENDTLHYDIYFGAINPPITQVANAQLDRTLSRPGLEINTTYFWKVVVNDGYNTAVASPIWHFTTGDGSTPAAGEERSFPLGTSGQSILMCWIPAGRFTMGSDTSDHASYSSECPQHTVTFASGFWMGKYEVTQQQWQAVMGSNPAYGYGVGYCYPVYSVSWDDIQTFESTLGNAFSLPSEAEWEYACRAGTMTRYYWGDDPNYSMINQYAWYGNNSYNTTHPVGSKLANAWGLFDMSGNVWEYCLDCYHRDYTGAPNDGSAWFDTQNNYRMLRGGSWFNYSYAEYCRSAHRYDTNPEVRNVTVGLRLCRRL